jgi:hypothetical protein
MSAKVKVPAALSLADPLRWRIIELFEHEDLVCHLVDELERLRLAITKVLRDAGLAPGAVALLDLLPVVPGALRS